MARQYDNLGGENDVLPENGGGSLPSNANVPPHNMMRASNQVQEAIPMNFPPISQPVPNRANRDLGFDGDDMDIPWCDLIIKERIGAGSLYRLLHKSGAHGQLDERCRLSMAYDVAKGMNYLHNRKLTKYIQSQRSKDSLLN